MKVLVATANRGKLLEIVEILAEAGITVVTPAELGITLAVVEDGESFAENALKKALAWHAVSGLPALADDSGLCVDALGGRPGVRSARFAGENATDVENNNLLLENLKGKSERRARFVCALALVVDENDIVTARGEYSGFILEKPLGFNGFGYDPVFLDPGSGKSFAELGPEEKNSCSHRRLALENLKLKLKERQSSNARGHCGGSDMPA